jgi:hypothetical protein
LQHPNAFVSSKERDLEASFGCSKRADSDVQEWPRQLLDRLENPKHHPAGAQPAPAMVQVPGGQAGRHVRTEVHFIPLEWELFESLIGIIAKRFEQTDFAVQVHIAFKELHVLETAW